MYLILWIMTRIEMSETITSISAERGSIRIPKWSDGPFGTDTQVYNDSVVELPVATGTSNQSENTSENPVARIPGSAPRFGRNCGAKYPTERVMIMAIKGNNGIAGANSIAPVMVTTVMPRRS
jgi:hypothetical protein